jgi:hypothetical protein
LILSSFLNKFLSIVQKEIISRLRIDPRFPSENHLISLRPVDKFWDRVGNGPTTELKAENNLEVVL